MTTVVLLTVMLPPTVVLRGPTPSMWDFGEAPFGIPETLPVIGIGILLLLLAGVVIWRVRRT